MNAARQASWLFCLLIALAASAWYGASSKELPGLDANTLANTADAVVLGLRVRQFSETGSLLNLLESREMQHIPHNNIHILTAPHIIVQEGQSAAWDIRSESAKSVQGKKITFINKVLVQQKDNGSTLTTEQLDYFPKEHLATSDKAVTFEQPGAILHAIGMKAHLKDKHVELLSHAKATYTVKHS